jgi:hypothetical protein
MTRLFILFFVMTLGIGRADVPKLFSEQAFNCATLADAVNHFVGLGEDAAVKELEQLSEIEAAEADQNRGFNTRGFSINERVAWVCRILFEPKKGAYIRAPKFGKLNLPEKYMPIAKWPLYPVALSGTTYFVLCESYSDDNNTPEEPKHYIEYSKANGKFRTTPVKVADSAQVLKDAAALRQSPPWQDIQWLDDSGYSYPMGEQWTWGFIQRQANLPANPPAKVRKVLKVPAKPPAN